MLRVGIFLQHVAVTSKQLNKGRNILEHGVSSHLLNIYSLNYQFQNTISIVYLR